MATKNEADRKTRGEPHSIAGWLQRHGLAQHVSVFAENAVDIDVLFDLTEVDFEKLGVQRSTCLLRQSQQHSSRDADSPSLLEIHSHFSVGSGADVAPVRGDDCYHAAAGKKTSVRFPLKCSLSGHATASQACWPTSILRLCSALSVDL
jgi:SAM domain (Sterile alpha motif)